MFSMQAQADLIVDLGSARDFMFLDISENPAMDAVLRNGVFNGNLGWSGGVDTSVTLRKGTLNGDIYLEDGSEFIIRRHSTFNGTEISPADMDAFKADVDAAIAQFGALQQDIYLGAIDQQGDFSIDRTDEYTVVDLDSLVLRSGTLTLNGQADDIFYIRVSNMFDLNNVDVVVNGTDSSRVFFIYDGTDDFQFAGGAFLGNIVAANSAVVLSSIDSFDGSLISGDGFSVRGADRNTVFTHTPAIPEPTVYSLVIAIGCGGIFIRRFFRFRKAESTA